MTDALRALRASTKELASTISKLADRLEDPAYPEKWTVADVVSHLGSGAVIFERRLDDALEGHPTAEGFAPEVWAEWDAKSPRDKARDGLAADEELTSRLERFTPDEAARVQFRFGAVRLDWGGFVRQRLSEHVLHTWDVAVVLDPRAELAAPAAELVIDNLELVARVSGRPGDVRRDVPVRTTTPTRAILVRLGRERVELDFSAPSATQDFELQLPTAAFVRLVYGRLDPGHTPSEVSGDPAVLDVLRRAFPGP